MRRRTKGRTPNRDATKRSNRKPSFEIATRRSSVYVFIWCLVLAVVTIAMYLPVMSHPFINYDYDDDVYVTGNPRVQAGLSAESVAWAFTSTGLINPIGILSRGFPTNSIVRSLA